MPKLRKKLTQNRFISGKKLVHENESFNVFSNDKRTNEMSQFLEKIRKITKEKEFNKSDKKKNK